MTILRSFGWRRLWLLCCWVWITVCWQPLPWLCSQSSTGRRGTVSRQFCHQTLGGRWTSVLQNLQFVRWRKYFNADFFPFSPKTSILGHVPNTGLYYDVDEYEEVSLWEKHRHANHNLPHNDYLCVLVRHLNMRGSRFSLPTSPSTLLTVTYMWTPWRRR